ncbi:hypothetical protein BJ138DRAFT_1072158 [Hygrophoropsis aurantiaca]|uniref:Uncharacterized protein n=1 Tax=Hygrophoropsis aurantiaca TaxID=72124 RepID=A0ACB7ZZE1_9AGAM|nr:hypothetical protein BJ138DRAFT_1072158 [Hygrophoropsis aurantiaca]
MNIGLDDHPLVLELTSLRQTASRFQHEAHTAALKLQRHSLDTSHVLERASYTAHENARLNDEVALLRAFPDITPHPASLQVQELTLALRRSSEKLDLTEALLSERTNELAEARGDLVRAKSSEEGAYELAARMRATVEDARAQERILEDRARVAEENRRMTDLVVQEYADLVRSLEGRASVGNPIGNPNSSSKLNLTSNGSTSTLTLVDSLHEGKNGLQRLFQEFNAEHETLDGQISDLRAQVSTLQARLEAERRTSAHDRMLLARAQAELSKLALDDKTAAKMVARYMKFSQSSTDALQKAMASLKARHAGTLNTVTSSLAATQNALTNERVRSSRLRDALDELCEDLAREAYARRREVGVRLALVAREERVAEWLRRWVRRAKERIQRTDGDVTNMPPDTHSAYEQLFLDAQSFVGGLDEDSDPVNHDEHHDDVPLPPSALARIIAAQDGASVLLEELHAETEKRLRLEGETDHALEPRAGESEDSQPLKVPVSSASETLPLTTPHQKSNLSTDNLRADENPMPVITPLDDHNDAPTTTNDTTVQLPSIIPDTTPPISTAVNYPNPTVNSDSEDTSNLMLPSPSMLKSTISSDKELSGDCIAPTRDSLTSALIEESSKEPDLVREGELIVPDSLASQSVVSDNSETNSQLRDTNSDLNTLNLNSKASELLSSLSDAKHRYDTLQLAFRDCHLALKDLKHLSSPNSTPIQGISPLYAALQHLDDHTEDTRVELEIRITDEELLARGFETLLSVPGALPTSESEIDYEDIERDIKAFVDDTDGFVDKFNQKLEDLQHDIAVIKRAVHEVPPSPSPSRQSSSVPLPSSVSSSSPQLHPNANPHPKWPTWTSGLLSSTRTSSNHTSAPTFGSVMTSPRLRHASSFTAEPQSNSIANNSDPLANLKLRIAGSSSYAIHPTPPVSYEITVGPAPTQARPRTMSTMYSLGLGSRSTSLALVSGSGSPRKGSGAGVGGGLAREGPGNGSPMRNSGQDSQRFSSSHNWIQSDAASSDSGDENGQSDIE